MPRGRDEACGFFLRQRIRSLPGLVHQGTLDQVTGPPPVHRGDRLQTYCWEWERVHGLRDRNGNYCRHNEHLWKLMIEHTDHVARLPLVGSSVPRKDILACKSKVLCIHGLVSVE